MQDGIAGKFGFIQRLVAQQASSYDVEIASQNARFETAFDHMTLGLRMYDAEDRLMVQNRRFSDMFDAEEATACLAAEAAVPGSYRRLLADGRRSRFRRREWKAEAASSPGGVRIPIERDWPHDHASDT